MTTEKQVEDRAEAKAEDKAEDRDRRFYQVIGESLADRIRNGEFSVGGRLPRERELAEAYNVGRTVIRDALVMLEIKGLVEIRQGSGIYVTRRAYETIAHNDDEPEEMRTPAGPFELLQARQWLESHIARLAALNATDEDIIAITEAYDDHQNAAYGEAKESMDIRFHMAIARATQNSELAALVDTLWHRRDNNPMWRSLHERIRDTSYRQRWVSDHDGLVQALTRRDGEAAYVAMWSHIENVKTFLMSAADVEPPVGEPSLTIVRKEKHL